MGEVKELSRAELPEGVPNLGQWAMRLRYDAARAMAGAPLVPAPVRRLVEELTALVGVLAREIDRVKGAQDGEA